MSQLNSLVETMISTIYTEDYPVINDMSIEMLSFYLNENSTIPHRLLLLLMEIEDKLNLQNRLMLKELRLKAIRNHESPTSKCSGIPEDDELYDEYGKIEIVSMIDDEVQNILSNCSVMPSELPRIPFREYPLIVKNADQHFEATYNIDHRGKMTEHITKWISGNPDQEPSGFSGIFTNLSNRSKSDV